MSRRSVALQITGLPLRRLFRYVGERILAMVVIVAMTYHVSEISKNI